MKLLHTSDLQLGRPFSHVEDSAAKEALRAARIHAIATLGGIARGNGCSAVLVAGDLFDSTSPDSRTVAAAMGAIAASGVPFYAIPGNHDNAGTGNFWEQDFFQLEQRKATNFHLLVEQKPVVLDEAVLFPCPLFRKQDSDNVLEWLLKPGLADELPEDRPWIVLAHGSIQGFGADASDEDDIGGSSNFLDLSPVQGALRPDYIALGDWHGQKQVASNAWYSGTPEQDRFPKGADYSAGKALLVDIAGRGGVTSVTPVETGSIRWTELPAAALTGVESVNALQETTDALLAGRVQSDSLKLTLTGGLDFETRKKLDAMLEHLKASVLRFKVDDQVVLRPSDEEIANLQNRSDNPVIARVAEKLVGKSKAGDETATMALRALYDLVH